MLNTRPLLEAKPSNIFFWNVYAVCPNIQKLKYILAVQVVQELLWEIVAVSRQCVGTRYITFFGPLCELGNHCVTV